MAQPPRPDEDPSLFQRFTAFETALLAGGLLLFIVLLYQMLVLEAFLTPPLTAIAALILLWPLRHNRAARAIMFSGAFLMGLWFLEELSTVLLPFLVVYLLAYLFDPVVAYAHRRYGVPRWVPSLGVTALVVGVFALFVFLVVPNIVTQIEVLAQRIVALSNMVREWLETTTLLDNLAETGLVDREELNRRLVAFAQEQAESLARSIPDAAEELLSSVGSLLGLVTTLAIIPVLLFYTLKDYPFITPRLVELFPTFGGRRDYLMKAGGIVGSYLRGQLTISAIAAFNVSVVLLLFDVPFALLIGLLGGLLNMIPNLGVVITNIVGVLIAFIFGDPWYLDAIVILATVGAQGLLEQAVLTPNILGYHVGLHPVLILLSLFVFGYFLGIFGFLIAVPATALIMTAYKSYRDQLSLELTGAAKPAHPVDDETLQERTEEVMEGKE